MELSDLLKEPAPVLIEAPPPRPVKTVSLGRPVGPDEEVCMRCTQIKPRSEFRAGRKWCAACEGGEPANASTDSPDPAARFKPAPEEELLTPTQAERRLGLTRGRVYYWLRRERLTPAGTNEKGVVLVRLSDVEAVAAEPAPAKRQRPKRAKPATARPPAEAPADAPLVVEEARRWRIGPALAVVASRAPNESPLVIWAGDETLALAAADLPGLVAALQAARDFLSEA